MTTATFDYTGYYTIVLTQHSNQETLQRILNDCWSLHIVNAVILIPTIDHMKIYLYAFFPYTPMHCEIIEPVVHDYFENGTFSFNTPIFPNKLRNFYQCPLMISTYTFDPFISLTPLSNGLFHMDGIEGRMLVTLAKRLNFRPVIQISMFNIDINGSNPHPTLRKSLDMVKFLFKEFYLYN